MINKPKKAKDINNWNNNKIPAFISENTVGTRTVIYKWKPIVYSILKKELVPTLKWFLWQKDLNFFISEDVPENFRDPQILHEIIEFTELKWKKWRCLESLKRELFLLDKSISQEYLKYRIDFFKSLIQYHKNTPSSEWFDADDLREEINKTYEYLKILESFSSKKPL